MTERLTSPNRRPGAGNTRPKKITKKQRRKRLLNTLAVYGVLFFSILLCIFLLFTIFWAIFCLDFSEEIFSHKPKTSPIRDTDANPTLVLPEGITEKIPENVPEEFRESLKRNPEMQDFVLHYAERETYRNTPIDLSADPDLLNALRDGEVPLLMQWDLRWGYAPYGNEMMGLAGCGPTCLSMAYIYLTGDTAMDPAAMADFAFRNGFCTEAGTDWALWTDGVSLLGLSGKTLSLDESVMKNALDNGRIIICSMRPGDFTTTGHIILIRGYDENGFYVNDPNRRSNSDVPWSYKKISPQIKNLWGIQTSE